ncbi:hypothetical protein GCM10010912_15040 [Paenibacillus albidus]|uniref:Uncharacterized protein n=1 Tax=Paenibacillus albidus TaxID=2041023 RepID=A0A917C636_9BACL|nr:hypothetical protein [Paenibacillus albidus]GGF70817.1 hypothetical protein GCM10010912_15040 [Paenibacillus albidus]
MTQVIDFGKSVLSSFSQSISIPVAGSPSSNALPEFGLATAQAGNVILNASVGIQTVLGSPDFLFSILRGDTTIFTVKASAMAVKLYESYCFSYVDTNVPAGYFSYKLTVSIVNPSASNTANLIGPVNFSGLSLG